jgi:molybdenum cofactor biosynthesis protein B
MAHEGPDHHHHEHEHEHHHGHAETAVGCWVVTCSDTRTPATDESGAMAKRLIGGAGHTLLGADVVKDDAAAITQALEHALAHGARCVIFTGGTGVGRRDVTVETLQAKFEKQLDGFGELFRTLSFQQVGSAAWLSRATAGVVQGALVFALPGSSQAVELAVSKLILPELGHAVREMLR